VISWKRGEEAAVEIEGWAKRIIGSIADKCEVSASYDADSSTYLMRLAKGSRVLLFRFSEMQMHTDGREAECEKTLKTKLKNLLGGELNG